MENINDCRSNWIDIPARKLYYKNVNEHLMK